MKSDIVTAIIYSYITTYYCSFITRNVTLAFQRMAVLCMGKNVNRHFSRNFEFFDIFVINITDLNTNTSIYWKTRVTFRLLCNYSRWRPAVAMSGLTSSTWHKDWRKITHPHVRASMLNANGSNGWGLPYLWPKSMSKNLIPYLCPDPSTNTLFQTCLIISSLVHNLWRAFVDVLIDNDEKVASS